MVDTFFFTFVYLRVFFFSLYEKIRRQLLIYNVIGKKDCFIQISFLMHRHRCYVTLLSLSVLYFFFHYTHTHVHSLHTPFVGQKKKRKREKKSKTAYRQITMLIVEHTSIHPPTSQMCALSLYCLSFCLCNQHMYQKSIFAYLTFYSFV